MLSQFRILGSVDMLNHKMEVNLTHHDINWVYNCQNLKGMGFYFKTKVPSIMLISCLLESNKGMDKDFMIISSEWHNGLHCPTQNREPGGIFNRHGLFILPR